MNVKSTMTLAIAIITIIYVLQKLQFSFLSFFIVIINNK